MVYFVDTTECFTTSVGPEQLSDTLATLATTSISLAGFVLASLTIVVTFKENVRHKEIAIDKIRSGEIGGIELLFSSRFYGDIVNQYAYSVFSFIVLFCLLMIFNIYSIDIGKSVIVSVCLTSIIFITLIIYRCIVILYKILHLQSQKKEEDLDEEN